MANRPGVAVSPFDDRPCTRDVVNSTSRGDLSLPPFDGSLSGEDVGARAPHARNLGARTAAHGQEGDLRVVRVSFAWPMSVVPGFVNDRRRHPQETLIVQPTGVAGTPKGGAPAVDHDSSSVPFLTVERPPLDATRCSVWKKPRRSPSAGRQRWGLRADRLLERLGLRRLASSGLDASAGNGT